jgi:hypothetical protein
VCQKQEDRKKTTKLLLKASKKMTKQRGKEIQERFNTTIDSVAKEKAEKEKAVREKDIKSLQPRHK